MERFERTYYYIFLAATGILTALFYAWVPFNGDDLAYLQIFQDHYSWPTDYFPRVVAHHWVFSNGRMADKLLIGALPGIPKPIIAALIGASFSGLLFLAGRWVKNRLWMAVALCLVLPWWDITNVATCFNYVLTAFMTLWALGCVIDEGRKWKWGWLQCLLVFIAMGMHEAAGVPAMLGITFARWRGFVKADRALFWSGWAGASFSILSPGNYLRLATAGSPDDSMPVLLLKSVPTVMVLLLIMLVMRKRVKDLWRSEWSIFVISALVSTGFCAISGIVGRSGWFATIYALIALLQMIPRRKWLPLALAVSLLYIGHLDWITRTQYDLYKEFEVVKDEYIQSIDGTVNCSPTMYSDLPYAAMLYRPICAPVPENVYEIQCFDHYYSNGLKHLKYTASPKPQWRPGMRPKPNSL